MSVLRSVIGPVTADVDVSSETALVALIGQGLLDGWAA